MPEDRTTADIEKEIPGIAITESTAQRAGVSYTAADGGKMKNEGQATIVHVTPQGEEVSFTFQSSLSNLLLKSE